VIAALKRCATQNLSNTSDYLRLGAAPPIPCLLRG
jgi:hypothetical protein